MQKSAGRPLDLSPGGEHGCARERRVAGLDDHTDGRAVSAVRLRGADPSESAVAVVAKPFSRAVRPKPLIVSIAFGGTVRAACAVRARAAVRGDAAGADASTSVAARATPATTVPESVVLIASIGALLLVD